MALRVKRRLGSALERYAVRVFVVYPVGIAESNQAKNFRFRLLERCVYFRAVVLRSVVRVEHVAPVLRFGPHPVIEKAVWRFPAPLQLG